MNITENVRQEVMKLLPASVLNDIARFVFYDHHPNDNKNIDITICTKSGELREYSQRDLQSSLNLNCAIKEPTGLQILRNSSSDLFYLLASNDELFIISSKEKLQIVKKLTNIDRYDINDTSCSGETTLKVIKKDDAVPILFDSNFECLVDYGVLHSPQNIEDSLPIVNELKRKLVETRYTAKCNEKTYAQYLNLHQKVSLLSYQNQQTVSNRSVFQNDAIYIGGVLEFKTHKPWVKVCNKKLLVMFNVFLQGKEFIKDIHILLNNPTLPSLVYTTKIFTKLPSPPFWCEPVTISIKAGQECTIIAIVNLDEIQQNGARVELSGSISYKVSESKVEWKECLVPFEDVVVSAMEMMGDEIDVLSSDKIDEQTILAILAATEKTELCLRHIKNDDEPETSLLNLFCTHLQMDRVGNSSNIIVYRKSPYHALNGTMLVLSDSKDENGVSVSVHTRTTTQVLVLLHHIYDTVPAKIIATTPAYKITSKTDHQSQYNEEISTTKKEINYIDFATSMLNRSAKILEHLDASMIKMNESRNPSVLNKVGSHIDLFACGVTQYKEFKEVLIKEAEKGVESLVKSEILEENTGSDVMIID